MARSTPSATRSESSARTLAVVDLGSGTFRLVLYSYEPGVSYRLLDELREAVALGQGLSSGRIRPEALERGIRTMRTFADYLHASPADEVITLATSAVREAENGREVLLEAERLGLRPRLLSGEEEAALGALAVTNALPFQEAIVVDQGGGSAQVASVKARHVEWGQALPFGALRLTEGFIRSDPPARAEVKAMTRAIEDLLKRVPIEWDRPIVGLGGNLRAIARLHQRRQGYPLDLLHGYFLPAEGIEQVSESILGMSLRARLRITGLQPDRAPTLPATLVFLRALQRHAGAKGLWVSGVGIREGALFTRLLPNPHLLKDPRSFSVENLFCRYPFAVTHRDRVRALSQALYDGLERIHGGRERERRLLLEAAYLHDIGMHTGYREHHKHGAELILSEPMFGFDHRDQALLALLVRYHRRGDPTLGAFRSLLPGQEGTLKRLAAMLRIAGMLDRTRSGRVRDLHVFVGEDVRLHLVAPVEPLVEMVEVVKQRPLFREAFGRDLIVTWENGRHARSRVDRPHPVSSQGV